LKQIGTKKNKGNQRKPKEAKGSHMGILKTKGSKRIKNGNVDKKRI
jgi:hypothetical protein